MSTLSSALATYISNLENVITAEILRVVVEYTENLEKRVEALEEKVKEQGPDRK